MSMPCPRCTYPLTQLTHQGNELDHCYRCGGSFLAPGHVEGAFGQYADPHAWKQLDSTTHLGTSWLLCAKGHGNMDAYMVSWAGDSVEVDVCNECGGLWLDANEGTKLYRIARAATNEQNMSGSESLSFDQLDAEHQEPGVGSYIFQLLTGFPIEVWNPVRKRAVVVLSLLAILTVIFGLEFLLTNGFRLTEAKAFFRAWGVVPLSISEGSGYHGLFSHMFLHAGLLHLLGNLYFLYIFGDNVEDRLGRTKFIILYLFAGLVGAGLHILVTQSSDMPMVGASGAIAGLMGAYLVLFPKVQVWVVILFIRFKLAIGWYFLLWVGLQFLIPLLSRSPGIAWAAHVGGFAAGIAVGFALRNTGQKQRTIV